MTKKPKPVPSEDEVTHAILEHLYDAYENPRGMDSHKLKINKIKSNLKKKGFMVGVFSTHPPIEQRIKRLGEMWAG